MRAPAEAVRVFHDDICGAEVVEDLGGLLHVAAELLGGLSPGVFLELSKDLQTRGVGLVVLDQGIDTSTGVGCVFFQILGAIAEHALMSERTTDGRAAARARGRTGGQEPKLGRRQAELAREMYEARELTVAQIAVEFGVTRPTLYRHLDRLDALETTQLATVTPPSVARP